MKTALRRIFESSAVIEIQDEPKIKSEPAFVTTIESKLEMKKSKKTVIGVVEGEGFVDVLSSKGEMRANY